MEKPNRPSAASYLFLVLPPLFWSSNFIVGKALVGTVPPWTLNAGRFVVSALILLPLLLYRQEWPPRRALVSLVLMSIAGVFAFNAVLYIGLGYTSATNATLVNSTTPVTTALIARLLIGEKLTTRRLCGALISLAGVAWIISQGSLEALRQFNFNRGDIIVFFATGLWGFYMVMAKPMMQLLSPLALTSITTMIGALLLLPAAFVELQWRPADIWRADVLLAFLYLGIFPSFISFLLWNRSIQTFGPSRASLAYNLLPLFAALLAVIFLGETIYPYQLLGGVAIITGVIVGTRE